ncbi:efflux RND transporter permease subunit [Tengunoibacter tsumagoiensis]|uniref:Hydrogenase expression protein n=1 Tax=Tengunoibacter tsumagoiensis TaxID=2014871 RepID=A0A402A6A4_9CHLR|nr:efflux RND transporter permease subunit [Tengunoibacter tsumagoiensis]GCE14521.1 hydrogenase expression protein [Tengunoibacter tsumagoiensis]
MSFLSRLSLANKSIVIILTLALLGVGIYLIPQLTQETLPAINFPVISVVTPYIGASPTTVEKDVTIPLEQSIKGLAGVKVLSSRTGEGLSGITLQYAYGTDMAQAKQDLVERIDQVKGNLPKDATPQVQVYDFNALTMMDLAVSAPSDQENLANDLQQKIVPELRGINGVANVYVTGLRHQIVAIQLDSAKMQANGISLDQIQGALQNNNISLPAGSLDETNSSSPIRVSNTFQSLQDLQNLTVGQKASRASDGSSLSVKLSDIATVTLSVEASTSFTRTNRQPTIGLGITKTSSGNTVTISHDIRAKLASIEQQLGSGAHVWIVDDEAPAIQQSIDGLVREGLLGAGFAILVILLFLLSLRSTLVTAISIPLSVIIGLIGLKVQNYSLNIMTLAGLTIAVGRVVDDSIVVLENIYRHLNLGEEKKSAVLAGVQEVAGAVTSSTITTVAVFLPIGFAGGFVSLYFKAFSITVAVALLASLLVSLTVIPLLSYWFLKADTRQKHLAADGHPRPSFLEKGYTPLLKWVITHRIITIAIAVLLLGGSVALVTTLPTNLLDSMNQNTYSINQSLPPGSNLTTISVAATKIEDVLAGIPEVKTYQIYTQSGSQSLNGNGDVVNTTYLTTDPDADQVAIKKKLQEQLQQIQGAGTITLAGQDSQNSTIQFQVQAPNSTVLQQGTQMILAAFSNTAHTKNSTSDLAGAAPLIDIHVNPEKASQNGLSTAQVGQYIRAIYTGATATKVTFNDTQLDVDLQLGPTATTIEQLRALQIPSPLGKTVALSDLADVNRTLEPPIIAHLDGDRTATISTEVTNQNVGGITAELQQKINALKLPAGVTVSQGGASQQMTEAFNDLYLALGAAVVLVFIVMIATFRSFVQPLILLVAIPFAGIGSLLLMFVTQTALGLPAMIGFLMLIGIVVTNAIVLIDRVNHFRATGSSAYDAVIMGATQRLRPILMTALATVFALLPMAVGLSPSGMFISKPLSIVVIGGLSSSTFLTLLLVPTLYVTVENIKDRLARKKGTEDRTPVTAPAPDDTLSLVG